MFSSGCEDEIRHIFCVTRLSFWASAVLAFRTTANQRRGQLFTVGKPHLGGSLRDPSDVWGTGRKGTSASAWSKKYFVAMEIERSDVSSCHSLTNLG